MVELLNSWPDRMREEADVGSDRFSRHMLMGWGKSRRILCCVFYIACKAGYVCIRYYIDTAKLYSILFITSLKMESETSSETLVIKRRTSGIFLTLIMMNLREYAQIFRAVSRVRWLILASLLSCKIEHCPVVNDPAPPPPRNLLRKQLPF
jgi:hypothetical protein